MTYLYLLNKLRQSFQDPRTKILPELNEVQVEAWLKMMSRYDMGAVDSLVTESVVLWKWFPTIQEFVKELKGDLSGQALEAWASVLKAARLAGAYRSVQFDDPNMADALRMAAGHWVRVCNLDTASFEYSKVRESFLELYELYAATPKYGAVIMGGIGSNNAPYVIGRVDDPSKVKLLETSRVAQVLEAPPDRREAAEIVKKLTAELEKRGVRCDGLK